MPRRISEADLTVPVLQVLARAPGNFMQTSDLIEEMEVIFRPVGLDAAILANRSDTRFSQIVRNIVSHRHSAGNMINDGLAEYDRINRGLKITQAGLDFLFGP